MALLAMQRAAAPPAQPKAAPGAVFAFPAGAAAGDEAAQALAMRQLARQILAVVGGGVGTATATSGAAATSDASARGAGEPAARQLDDLFRLQEVGGDDTAAIATMAALRELRSHGTTPEDRAGPATNRQYEIAARARLLRQDGAASGSSDQALAAAFRSVMGSLDDRTSALVMRALSTDPAPLRRAWSAALERSKGRSTLTLPEAVSLVRAYQVDRDYRSLIGHTAALIAEDDERRYIVQRDILVRAPGGANLCVLVMRPRGAAPVRLPALLNFTIYTNNYVNEARRSASHGYAAVAALTRGKGCSPDQPVPYEHDGADAAAVIDWISRQPWSDGRTGMYGGSYEGFTQWAAAKHMPKGLKALMPSVTAAPGIDVPMEGNVFQTFVYYWPFYAASSKGLDDDAMQDRARWFRMQRAWYAAGRAYRDLDKIDGTPNPFFDRWLDHPAYDAYWQRMIPYGDEFAHIDIPVLTTTGYYDGGQIGALYYFQQHHAARPAAEHYLLIGPYDHVRGQRGTLNPLGEPLTELNGYPLDPAAQIDLGELRYEWFDYVLRGARKPAALQDRVNYEVMGANEWRHAPSLAAMGPRRLTFRLSSAKVEPTPPGVNGASYQLLPDDLQAPETKSAPPAERAGRAERRQGAAAEPSIDLTINLADRSDIDEPGGSGNIIDHPIDASNGILWLSAPLAAPFELSGLFAGDLDFVTNKRDFDVTVSLYELTPQGDAFALSTLLVRASYLADRTTRHLLQPDAKQHLHFTAGRLTSRRFEPGSRLAVVLAINKGLAAQINYGTGKDVSKETLADAGQPLRLQVFSSSAILIPSRH